MAFDCPVTGGESGAIAGTLTAIVGATENDIAPVRDILSTFAATIFCFDGAGKGQAAKLANQVSLGACMVGMADAMAFAELSGLDVEKTRQMILGGTGKSGAMESLAPKALDGDYKPGFMVEHFIKDVVWRSPMPTTASSRCLAPTWPLRSAACSMPSVAPAGHPGHHGPLKEEADAIAAGLDWSQYRPEEHGAHEDGCGCGDHGDDHECGCGHHHGEDHECCGGHGNDDGHECCWPSSRGVAPKLDVRGACVGALYLCDLHWLFVRPVGMRKARHHQARLLDCQLCRCGGSRSANLGCSRCSRWCSLRRSAGSAALSPALR